MILSDARKFSEGKKNKACKEFLDYAIMFANLENYNSIILEKCKESLINVEKLCKKRVELGEILNTVIVFIVSKLIEWEKYDLETAWWFKKVGELSKNAEMSHPFYWLLAACAIYLANNKKEEAVSTASKLADFLEKRIYKLLSRGIVTENMHIRIQRMLNSCITLWLFVNNSEKAYTVLNNVRRFRGEDKEKPHIIQPEYLPRETTEPGVHYVIPPELSKFGELMVNAFKSYNESALNAAKEIMKMRGEKFIFETYEQEFFQSLAPSAKPFPYTSSYTWQKIFEGVEENFKKRGEDKVISTKRIIVLLVMAFASYLVSNGNILVSIGTFILTLVGFLGWDKYLKRHVRTS